MLHQLGNRYYLFWLTSYYSLLLSYLFFEGRPRSRFLSFCSKVLSEGMRVFFFFLIKVARLNLITFSRKIIINTSNLNDTFVFYIIGLTRIFLKPNCNVFVI
ncbi:hypothetical protein BDC45DRAFT_88349 [Circinella umbellata]|nr:hypothetical protein BDC45DRAFT_88349 [Circinella umbellata]